VGRQWIMALIMVLLPVHAVAVLFMDMGIVPDPWLGA
jgi:hypothetical protein